MGTTRDLTHAVNVLIKKNVTEKTQRRSRLFLPASVFPSPFRLNLSHLVPLKTAEHFRSPRRWETTLQNLKTCERDVFFFRNTSKHLLFSCHYLNNNLTEKDVEEEYCCRFTYNPATSKGIRKHKPLRGVKRHPKVCIHHTTPYINQSALFALLIIHHPFDLMV